MKNMNIIYVNFEQEKEKSFFQIPRDFNELKISILDEWDYLEEKGLIIEDMNNTIIKDQNDFLAFKQNSKDGLIVNIKYNGNYQKKPDLSIKEITNRINFNKNIQNDNVLETIENLNKKLENLKKDIEFIKRNKSNMNDEIDNLEKLIYESTEKLNEIKNID